MRRLLGHGLLLFSAVLVVGGWVYFINPLYTALQQAHLTMDQLQLSEPVAMPGAPGGRDTLEQLLTLLEESRLSLRTLTMIAPGQFSLSAAGQFAQLYSFVSLLLLRRYPLDVHELSLKALPHHQLVLELDFAIEQQSMPENKNSLAHPFASQLFCGDPPRFKQPFSYTEMRLAGVLAQGRESTALLALPSQGMLTVKRGDRVGREHGIVTAVTAQSVSLMLPNKKIVLIR